MASGKRGNSDAAAERQRRSKELSKRYQKEAAQLKRKGLLSTRVNARKDISRSTRTKINKLRGVLEGTQIAVKAPREVRAKYKESDRLPTVGRYVLAPREFENSKAAVKRGMVAVQRRLGEATEEYVILPFRPVDIPDLVTRLKADPTLNDLKHPDEYFSFRLGGRNSQQNFQTVAELAEYIELKYQHLFNQPGAVKYLTFQRYYMTGEQPGFSSPFQGNETKVWHGIDAKGRSITRRYRPSTQASRNKDAERKRKARASETDEQNRIRKTKNASRSAAWRVRNKGDW